MIEDTNVLVSLFGVLLFDVGLVVLGTITSTVVSGNKACESDSSSLLQLAILN